MSPPKLPTPAIILIDELPEESIPGTVEKKDENIKHGTQVAMASADPVEPPPTSKAPTALENSENRTIDSQPIQDSITGNAEGYSGSSASGDTQKEAEELEVVQDPMESSTATLKPVEVGPPVILQHLSPEDNPWRDPTPKTPGPSRSTSHATSNPPNAHRTANPDRSPTRSDAGFDDRNSASEDERETSSRAEIQSIMDQFSEEGQGPGHEEVMSPRLEFAGPLLGAPIQHPPRKSSLEPLSSQTPSAIQSLQELRLSSNSPSQSLRDQSDVGPAVPPKPGSIHSFTPSRISDDRHADSILSPPLHRPPPPEPEPEPDLPFDFHRFLEQLRHRTADPVAKFLRSFLQEFGKKQWMVHEQVKIISDFLAFITNKMAQCDVWREVSDAEFDNAREGMEKLVMNRLYTQTFSPAIPPPQPIPGPRTKRRGGERLMGPGRRGQHQEDVERDDILAQKISIYGWVKEEHLDIQPVGDSGKRFLILAQQGKRVIFLTGLRCADTFYRTSENQDV